MMWRAIQPRRMISTEAYDWRGYLHNSLHLTKAEFNNCFIIHSRPRGGRLGHSKQVANEDAAEQDTNKSMQDTNKSSNIFCSSLLHVFIHIDWSLRHIKTMLSEKVIENTGGITYNQVLLEYLIINVANKEKKQERTINVLLKRQHKHYSNSNILCFMAKCSSSNLSNLATLFLYFSRY